MPVHTPSVQYTSVDHLEISCLLLYTTFAVFDAGGICYCLAGRNERPCIHIGPESTHSVWQYTKKSFGNKDGTIVPEIWVTHS